MMKRVKSIILVWICLCIWGSVSCTKEEMEPFNDDRLVGAWKLGTVICHVNASDEYLATILQQK
ncbi:MAG: hypothetical protein LIP01_01565 [Tannerellaceae bacterium]|nr:hypothetical protein [Tannerellaceae bacterium]